MLLAELSLGDENETGQARFRRQQVVATAIESVFSRVVPNGEKISRLVLQELEVHIGQFLALTGNLFQPADARRGALRGVGHRAAQLLQPVGGRDQVLMLLARCLGQVSLDGVNQWTE